MSAARTESRAQFRDLRRGAAYRLVEYPCRVHTTLAVPGRIVRAMLAPFEVPAAEGPEFRLDVLPEPVDGDRYRLVEDGREVARVTTAIDLADEVLFRLNRAAIASAPGVAVHAGAVSLEGRGVVLPAPMDRGKSTLTAGLVAAGFSYLSDEAALFAPATGELVAYPKPLCLSPGSVGAVDGLRDRVMPEYRAPGRVRTYVRPDDLRAGAGAVGGPCPVGLVIAPRFLAGSPIRVEPMSRAATLMCLAANSFNLHEHGGRGLELLRRAAAGARGYRLTHGDLGGAVRTIFELLHQEANAR